MYNTQSINYDEVLIEIRLVIFIEYEVNT